MTKTRSRHLVIGWLGASLLWPACGNKAAPALDFERVKPALTGDSRALGFSVEVPKGAKPHECSRSKFLGLECTYKFRLDPKQGKGSDNRYRLRILQPAKGIATADQAQVYATTKAMGATIVKRRRLDNGGLALEFKPTRLGVKVFQFYKLDSGYIALECSGPGEKHLANLRRMCASLETAGKVASN